MIRSRLLILFVFSALLLRVSSPASAAVTYRVTDLGELPSFPPYSSSAGLNSYGQVTGVSYVGNLGHEFLWTPTSQNGTSGSMIDLGGMGDVFWMSGGRGINATGQVAGDYFKNGGGTPVATLWQPTSPNATTGTLISLGFLPGGIHSQAASINSFGQVAGLGSNSSLQQHATLWTPSSQNGTTGSMIDLGDLPGGSNVSSAAGINDLGQVVGEGSATTGTRGFLWTPSTTHGTTGSMIDLGDLSGGSDRSTAAGVNGVGQVVGYSNAASGDRAFLWTPNAPNSSTGGMIDLGVLPGGNPTSEAKAINGQGVVVGESLSALGQRAFNWSPNSANGTVGTMLDLNALMEPVSGSGWTLAIAYGINNMGQITGYGQFSTPGGVNVGHAFLLTPIPEPMAASLVFILASCLAAVWRRRA
jgi:probable HAF family extracellular repeat protein